MLRKQLMEKEAQCSGLNGKLRAVVRSKKDVSGRVAQVSAENEKLTDENVQLKAELKGIDATFFDELEDMKYALQQSAKLNTGYERALKRVCKRFGINFDNALVSPQK